MALRVAGSNVPRSADPPREWTEAELVRLRAMLADGASLEEMAAALDRPAPHVQHRILMLDLPG